METNVKQNSELAKALLEAQKEMGNATKDSSNPFFKSKYADLNAIREACMPALNKHGIVVLQPTVSIDGKNYVKTLLLHESGESMECLTEIIYSKQNDAQAQGSGITYARRYGLQSFVNVGADDDDGNKASTPQAKSAPSATAKPIEKTTPKLPITEKQMERIIERINKGEPGVYENSLKAFVFTEEQRADLEEANANQPKTVTA